MNSAVSEQMVGRPNPRGALGAEFSLTLMRPAQFRLRIEEIRVFYDVTGNTVEVLAIAEKAEALSWLARFGNVE